MKSGSYLPGLAFVSVMLLAGCLSTKPVTVSTRRHFDLAPISANEPDPPATGHLSIGIGFVKMPSYLLRNSMAVRNGANEIQYIEDALWVERLDQCFQRTLAANLTRLLSSDSIYVGDWGRDQVHARLFIDVQQFDVDTRGRGTLIAQWRITARDSDMPLKSGQARLDRTGASPGGNTEVIATTMSELAAEFSRQLAESIRESVKPGP